MALIEDETDVRESMVRLLVHNGCSVLAAADAERLLHALRTRERQPDILLSDYRLARGNGIDAIHRLRQACGRQVPALLLTGSTDPADVERFERAGIEVLFKPFGIVELRQAIVSVLAASGGDSLGIEDQVQT